LRERLCRSLDDSGTGEGRSRAEPRREEGERGRTGPSVGSLPLGGWNDAPQGRPEVGALGLLQGWTSPGCVGATKSRGAVAEVLQDGSQREAVVRGEVNACRCPSPVRLNLARYLRTGYHGPRWTLTQLRLLGKYPDEVVAAKTGRTVDAVRCKRTRLGIL